MNSLFVNFFTHSLPSLLLLPIPLPCPYSHSTSPSSLGSGPGGLSLASLLAHHGKKVVVLEQHDRAGSLSSIFVYFFFLRFFFFTHTLSFSSLPSNKGGGTHTFTDKGFEWDTAFHYLGEVQEKHWPLRRLVDYLVTPFFLPSYFFLARSLALLALLTHTHTRPFFLALSLPPPPPSRALSLLHLSRRTVLLTLPHWKTVLLFQGSMNNFTFSLLLLLPPPPLLPHHRPHPIAILPLPLPLSQTPTC